ncbi:uncharacterized protein EDB91DRAFT_1349157 [Suillus paluster]|uniref:uncharacterized protein n=1 Tax=Suillus paluster TaxID=48578 RepID=UPI001B85DDF8|nr:uncharacterized protein EDB91DRAFT_1349157 [Suillus paluster]KAG1732248.1 hypothetical protein EDB91DRAFT_1349157 [Suillus paluster]
MPEQLTLYLLKLSPLSQKIELALVEANAPYKAYQVDIFNKPEWFASKVNPIGRVPVVTYGGPDVDPEDPSPLSAKISESNIILEFVAYPDSGLLPKDPVLRANVHFFINATTKHIEDPFYAFLRGLESYENGSVLKGIEFIQGLFKEGRYFAVGDHYTIADACITPHLARLKIVTETDIGDFPVGAGYMLGEELKGPKFSTFMKYVKRMLEHRSFKQIHDEESVIAFFKKIFIKRVQ